jgi:hypothetical protein
MWSKRGAASGCLNVSGSKFGHPVARENGSPASYTGRKGKATKGQGMEKAMIRDLPPLFKNNRGRLLL